jgi:predicted DNA-binding transcriptional regulator AlpA
MQHIEYISLKCRKSPRIRSDNAKYNESDNPVWFILLEKQMHRTTILNEKDAGKFLGGSSSPVSVRTLQRWRLEGTGPRHLKLNRLVRYRESDLETFMEERACSSTSTLAFTQPTLNSGGMSNV